MDTIVLRDMKDNRSKILAVQDKAQFHAGVREEICQKTREHIFFNQNENLKKL